MYATNNGKEVGRIYSFEIETRKPGIQIREVWFGNTPVPCDVYRSGQSVRCDSMLSPGFYTVRVNRDLFRNYPTQTDSTQAARQFKKPFSFRGDAVLLVQYKGKTCYRILNGVMPVKQKSYR